MMALEQIPVGRKLLERTVRREVALEIDSLRAQLDDIKSLLQEILSRYVSTLPVNEEKQKDELLEDILYESIERTNRRYFD